MQAETLKDVFERGLELAYDYEHRFSDALASMAEAASSHTLRDALEEHLEYAKRHIERIDEIFSTLDRAAAKEHNHAVQGMIAETEKLMKHIDASPLRDAALIAGGTQIDHYGIALYRSLCLFARVLNLKDSARLLDQTLDEERAADQRLIQVGDESIYREAARVETVNHEFNFI